MTVMSMEDALANIYSAVNNNNEDLDHHIVRLKEAMAAENLKSVTIDPAQLVHNNRQGRKLMQAYFRKRGVSVEFAA